MMRARLLGFIAAMSVAANATPITWSFGGFITSVDHNLSPYFSVGDAYSGSITFENSAIFSPYPDDPADVLRYPSAVTSFSYTIGSYSGTASSDHSIGALLSVGSALTFATNGDEADPLGAGIGGWLPRYFAVRFNGYSATQLSDAVIEPAQSSNVFRMDFSMGGSQVVALTGAWSDSPPVPTPTDVPDGRFPATAVALLGCLTAARAFRR